MEGTELYQRRKQNGSNRRPESPVSAVDKPVADQSYMWYLQGAVARLAVVSTALKTGKAISVRLVIDVFCCLGFFFLFFFPKLSQTVFEVFFFKFSMRSPSKCQVFEQKVQSH